MGGLARTSRRRRRGSTRRSSARLIARFVRPALRCHATFAVNSLAHDLGSQPCDTSSSARFVAVLVEFGEGDHHFHHHVQCGDPNVVHGRELDATEWFAWTPSKVGVTCNLRRTAQGSSRRGARTKARRERRLTLRRGRASPQEPLSDCVVDARRAVAPLGWCRRGDTGSPSEPGGRDGAAQAKDSASRRREAFR